MIMTIKTLTIRKSEGVYFEEPKVLYDDSNVVEVPEQVLPYNETKNAIIPGSTVCNDYNRYKSFCAVYWAARCKNHKDRKIFCDLSPADIKEFVSENINSGMFEDSSNKDKQMIFYNSYFNFLTCNGIIETNPDEKINIYSPGSTLIQTYPYKLTMKENELNSIDLPINVQLGLIMEARWELVRYGFLLLNDGNDVYINRISDKNVRTEVIKFFTQHPKVGKPICEAPDEIRDIVRDILNYSPIREDCSVKVINRTYTLDDEKILEPGTYDDSRDVYKDTDETVEDDSFMETYEKVTREFDKILESINFDSNKIDFDDIFNKVKSATNERLAKKYINIINLRASRCEAYWDDVEEIWKKNPYAKECK